VSIESSVESVRVGRRRHHRRKRGAVAAARLDGRDVAQHVGAVLLHLHDRPQALAHAVDDAREGAELGDVQPQAVHLDPRVGGGGPGGEALVDLALEPDERLVDLGSVVAAADHGGRSSGGLGGHGLMAPRLRRGTRPLTIRWRTCNGGVGGFGE